MAKVIYANEAYPIVPNPPTGSYYLGVDPTDGALKLQNSAGSVFNYNSGALYDDADAVAAVNDAIVAAALKANPTVDDYVYLRDVTANAFRRATKASLMSPEPDRYWNVATDFVGTVTGDFQSFVSGTAASSQNGTYGQDLVERAIGVTQSDTGSTSTGRAGIGLVSGAILRPTIARLKFCSRQALEALSDITNTFVMRIGFGDFYTAAGDGTAGLYFRYTDLQNGGRWEAVSRAGSVDLTAVDTGVAPDLDYHTFEVELNELNTQAIFKIDGATVATINSPLLPGGANPFGAGFKIEKTVGTTQRNVSSDWMFVEYERSSAR